MDPLLLEAILATVGVPPKGTITLESVRSSSRIKERWNPRIVSFVSGEQGKFVWETSPTSEELRGEIAKQPDADDVVKWAAKIDGDPMVAAFLAGKVKQVSDYLMSIWPTMTIDVPGAPLVPLSRDDLDSVWSVCRVLWKPERILDEISAWTLTEAQAKAFRAIFPVLSKSIDTMIATAYIERIGDGDHITPEVDDTVRTWKLMPLDTPIKFENPKNEKAEPSNIPSEELINAAKAKAPSEFAIGERIGK